jgi:hypothetical protein
VRVMAVAASVVLAVSVLLSPQLRAAGSSCRAVSFTVELDAGKSYVQEVGGLHFKITAADGKGSCNGWSFTLEDAEGNDFIYPVNMPLRFNPSQFLGCSYGLTAKQGLEMKRSMRFILNEQDYLRLDPLMRNALWPYSAPDPEHAGEKYLDAISAVQTGLMRLNTVRYKISPDGLIQSATFRVELLAPESFSFGQGLKPHSTPCPESSAE